MTFGHLPDELVQSQQMRSKLLQWKMVIIAALGAIGLGFSDTAAGHKDLVLCCIPFVAVYVDAMCRHLSLRVMVIGRFHSEMLRYNISDQTDNLYLSRYSRFSHLVGKKGAFSLEKITVIVSTLLVCLAIGLIPFFDPNRKVFHHPMAVQISGLTGLIFSIGLEIVFRSLKRKIDSIEFDENVLGTTQPKE